MIRESIQMRIKQALDTVTYDDSIKCHIISAKYWENLEQNEVLSYFSLSDLKHDLIKEITRRWA